MKWVGPHEGALDDYLPLVDLPMIFPLVVIPDPTPFSGNTVRMDRRTGICQGLKLSRCGLTRGTGSQPHCWRSF
jgi:hypothetical protein